MFSSESELESEAEKQRRIGDTDWCQCGECKPMTTHTEGLCCQYTNENLEELFEGKNALQNKAGSEWFAWNNQYYILPCQPLIMYVVILWRI